jgi:TonB family protein
MSKRLILARFVWAVLTASLTLGSVGLAQTGTTATATGTTTSGTTATATTETQRKVKSQVAPAYPDLAKQMNVSGTVKLEVVIAQDGHVKSTKAVGGHPLLVSASEDAVKKWKFQPASEDTTEVLQFDFHRE